MGLGLSGRAFVLTPFEASVCFKRLLCSNHVCMSSSESLSLLTSLQDRQFRFIHTKQFKLYLKITDVNKVLDTKAQTSYSSRNPCKMHFRLHGLNRLYNFIYLSFLICNTCWTLEMICCCSLTFWS